MTQLTQKDCWTCPNTFASANPKKKRESCPECLADTPEAQSEAQACEAEFRADCAQDR